MPDHRKHRGPHPEDDVLFGPPMLIPLQHAVEHTAWLLSRGYAFKSSIQLVGDRFRLNERQRIAVLRSTCSDPARAGRQERRVACGDLAGVDVDLDGFNVLTTVEAALAGGVILAGRDGCYRDMASMHGSYRKVEETETALSLIGACLAEWQTGRCTWYLDRPVSNSGRLSQIIQQLAQQNGWPWQTELACDVDRMLKASTHVVASADSVVIDHCLHWVNLAREVICRRIPAAKVIAMTG